MASLAEAHARFTVWAGMPGGLALPRTPWGARLGARTDGMTCPMPPVSPQAGSASARSISSRTQRRPRSTAERSRYTVEAFAKGVRQPAITATRVPLDVTRLAYRQKRALDTPPRRGLRLSRDDGPCRFALPVRVLLSRQGLRCGRTGLETDPARIRNQGPSRLSKGLLLFMAQAGRRRCAENRRKN